MGGLNPGVPLETGFTVPEVWDVWRELLSCHAARFAGESYRQTFPAGGLHHLTVHLHDRLLQEHTESSSLQWNITIILDRPTM